jgi:predicted ATP-grasp superfamily ATP-dependent carboligase
MNDCRKDGNGRSVLLGFAEATAAPEAAWSLVDAGFSVTAFARRGSSAGLRRSRLVRIVEVPAPEDDAAACVAAVSEVAQKLGAEVVLPLDDSAVWILDRAHSSGTKVAGPTDAQARLALDKRLQISGAQEAGFCVPPTVEVPDERTALEATEFPCILKPALAIREVNGRLTKGRGYPCANRADLEHAVERWKGSEPMLLQPFLKGSGEGFFGFMTASGLAAHSGHRRVRMINPMGSGSSACAVSVPDQNVRACSERMMKAAGWRGLFMIELLRTTDDRCWFMELNGRTWGSTALARRMGLEYPAWNVLQVLCEEFEPPATHSNGTRVCRHLGTELVHLLLVLRGPRGGPMDGWPGKWKTLRDVMTFGRDESWYNWRRGELPVFMQDTWTAIADRLGCKPGRTP